MKYTLQDFKKLLPELSWTVGELADKLSAIGFETEIIGDTLDVTLTSNRKDCQDLRHLAFDLAGVYDFKTIDNLISFKPGQAIPVTAEDINKLLGSNIGPVEMEKLKRLGFEVAEGSVTPPNFRDVATIADVAEEIVRIIGYNQLEIKPLTKQTAPPSVDFGHLQQVKIALTSAGLTETATSSFSNHGHVKLKNPFSDDEPFLRESLLDGLLKTLSRNPFLKRATFFEIGSVFTPAEEVVVGLIVAGYKNADELLKSINNALGETINFETVDPAKCQKLDAKQGRVIWTQLSLEAVKPTKTTRPTEFTAPLPIFKPISKYPPLTRDVTIPNANQDSQTIIAQVNKHFGERLLLAEQIDQYGESITLRFIFQKIESSFTQQEIDKLSVELDTFLKPFGTAKI